MLGRKSRDAYPGGARSPAGNLYTSLILGNCNSHGFLILRNLSASSLHQHFEREQQMFDLVFLALGIGLFGLSIGYAVACDRL